jgi:hypothetical protein
MVDIVTRACPQAEVMQPDSLLHEALAGMFRVARLDTDRGTRSDAIEKPVAVEHDFHSELGQQLAVKLACFREAAHGQDDMRHAVDVDRHGSVDPVIGGAAFNKVPSRK